MVAGDVGQIAALELVLERLALRFGALQNGVGLADHVGQGFIGEVVEAGRGYGIPACAIAEYLRTNQPSNARELYWIAEQLAFSALALTFALMAVI